VRKFLPLICILGFPSASWAQSSQASWQNLNTLQAGQKIQVVKANSKKGSGTFLNVSDTAISLREPSGEQTIPKQDVRIVRLMNNKHRLRNTLIGAGVGAGAGAGAGAAAYGSSKPCPSGSFVCGPLGPGRGVLVAAGAVVGLLGGAIIGALLPSHKTIYHV